MKTYHAFYLFRSFRSYRPVCNYFIFTLLGGVIFTSCEKEEPEPRQSAPQLNVRVADEMIDDGDIFIQF